MSLVWTAEELCKHLFPSTFLMEPVLPRGGLALCYGKRGIGKSHFALTLAACMCDGGTLFGRYRTRRGPIVYVQCDMGAPLMQERVRIARRTYALDNVYFTFPDYLNIPELDNSDNLVKDIKSRQPELVIWDTLRQSHRMDMNSSETPAWVYGNVKHLFPGVAHLFIHHEKKTIADQDKLEDSETFSGTSAWIDNVDLGLRLREIGPNKLAMDFTKVRTAARQESLAISLHLETMLLYALGEPPQALSERWLVQHPNCTKGELERFLLASFTTPPRTLKLLMGEGGLTGRYLPPAAGIRQSPTNHIQGEQNGSAEGSNSGGNGAVQPHVHGQATGLRPEQDEQVRSHGSAAH